LYDPDTPIWIKHPALNHSLAVWLQRLRSPKIRAAYSRLRAPRRRHPAAILMPIGLARLFLKFSRT
jgi:hypothetical protein